MGIPLTALVAAALALASTAAAQDSRPANKKPHIVLFLADDLGWKDVGYHGSEIKTPHIDQLAKNGTRLEQFYVQPLCSPTRAALLTGRYPIRTGLQVGVVTRGFGLGLEEKLLPQILKEAGYVTAICGLLDALAHELRGRAAPAQSPWLQEHRQTKRARVRFMSSRRPLPASQNSPELISGCRLPPPHVDPPKSPS